MIIVIVCSGMPNDGREYSSKATSSSDEMDSNAARSLFVGNIPKNISIYELRDIFQRHGPVVVRLSLLSYPPPILHFNHRIIFFSRMLRLKK